MTISFTVPGRPQPQGSMKRRGAGMTHSNPRLDQWRKDVGSMACGARMKFQDAVWPMADRPFDLCADFYFARPPSQRHNPEMIIKPDRDKLERAIMDALTGIIWADDCLVVAGYTYKHWGFPERAEIEIRLL